MIVTAATQMEYTDALFLCIFIATQTHGYIL